MDEQAELAALYDAVYGEREDIGFWPALATETDGPVLELGCGTGRVLIPVARAGVDITGLDLSAAMLDRCRAKLDLELPEVQARAELVLGDMRSFDLGRRFALITIPFAGFQHLRTVGEQLACLACCRRHLEPRGRLALDMPNSAPAPPSNADELPVADGEAAAEVVEWTGGRHVRWWSTVTHYDPLQQCSEYEVTYQVVEKDGSSRELRESFPLRYVFRYELEHLFVRAGFRLVALYGDHDRSPLMAGSPALIAVAEMEPE